MIVVDTERTWDGVLALSKDIRFSLRDNSFHKADGLASDVGYLELTPSEDLQFCSEAVFDGFDRGYRRILVIQPVSGGTRRLCVLDTSSTDESIMATLENFLEKDD